MAAATTVNPSSVADEQYARLLSKDLHIGVQDKLVMARYGRKWRFEDNPGTETMRMFRRRRANTTYVSEITVGANEMVKPSTLMEVGRGYAEVTLKMYGQEGQVSRRQSLLSIFNEVRTYQQALKEDMGKHCDEIIRNALLTAATGSTIGTSATSAVNKFVRFAGVDNGDSQGNASVRYGLFNTASATPSNTKLTRLAHLGMITHLRDQQVPDMNGQYPVLLPPVIYGDLQADGTVIAAMTQVDTEKLWKGGIGYLDGSPIIQHDNPFRLNGTFNGTHVAAGAHYACIYLGRDAFQVPDMAPKGAASFGDYRTPKINILDSADKTDSFNLYTLVNASTYWGCGVTFTSEATDVPYYGVLFATTHIKSN